METRDEILQLVRKYYSEKFGSPRFNSESGLIHYAGRVFDEQELVNLVDASLDFYLTANRYAEQFESRFADYMGLSNALLVNSGSSANLIALSALTSTKLGDRRLKPSAYTNLFCPVVRVQSSWHLQHPGLHNCNWYRKGDALSRSKVVQLLMAGVLS